MEMGVKSHVITSMIAVHMCPTFRPLLFHLHVDGVGPGSCSQITIAVNTSATTATWDLEPATQAREHGPNRRDVEIQWMGDKKAESKQQSE
jgi:hypothetical protein